jgi:hypothetical protein
MKRPIYLTLAVVLALAVFGCKKEPDEDSHHEELPKTLDPRLIGGSWYFPDNISLTQKQLTGCYEFTEDSRLICSDDSFYVSYIIENWPIDNMSGTSVYSKDGIVYWKETNEKVMSYSFHSEFPYKDGPATDTTLPLMHHQRSFLDLLASENNLITYRIYLYDNPETNYRVGSLWFLVRFNDDED